jgi:hypothetical protein
MAKVDFCSKVDFMLKIQKYRLLLLEYYIAIEFCVLPPEKSVRLFNEAWYVV